MSELNTRAMRLAVELAAKSPSEDERAHPKVGAVLVKDGAIVQGAFRGEVSAGDHAEYTLFEKKLASEIDPRGGTLFTTLEPCTERKQRKTCCEWIVQKGITKVFIGILDPNPHIYSQALQYLRRNGIQVDFFPLELRERIREDNVDFIAQFFANPELSGQATFNYSANNGRFTIGHGDLIFETRWSKASDVSIHAYNDGANIRALRLALGASSFHDLKDGSVYDGSSRVQTAREGELLVWENTYGYFAAVQVLDVKDRTRPPDKFDSLTISYLIRSDGSPRFTD
jgi:pyrimidine deaminase RibD-like protein